MRYLKATLIIGFVTIIVVAALLEAGAFHQLDQGLANFLGLRYSIVAARLPQYLIFLPLAFAVAWTTVDIPRNSLKVVIFAGTLAQVMSAVWVCLQLGFFFSPFACALAVVIPFTVGFIYAQGEGGSRKRVVRSIFGDRISKRTFSTLINSDIPLRFEGEQREATVVVCEIFNHDQLADALPVADYVALNNSFLRNAADFLVERGGYLDECDGESLRVVFGTPVPDSAHAATACEAALALAACLDEVNKECFRVWQQTFDFRLGINSGEMVVAAYGSRRLGTFSIAGEPVEWTRRLCAANLIYGSRIIIGALTGQLAENAMEMRPLELLRRHPKDLDREEIYELLARKNSLSEEEVARRDAFWRGIVYFRAHQWELALEQFRHAHLPGVHDGPLEFYVRRVDQVRHGMPILDWAQGRM